MIIAAADGSSLSNPGPAGWAWYVSDDIWAAGGWPHGTNNMGELMAVLDLLRSTAHRDEPLTILCDSQYVINSLTKWLPGWKRKGWKKGDGKPVLNVELMKDLDKELRGRDVTFEWVKGHAGHRMNEAADERARAAATAYQQGREPDAGPGFPEIARPAGRTDFAVGAVDEQPDLFSDAPDADAPRPVAGSAAPRQKAALVRAARALFDDPSSAPLHSDFVCHGGGVEADRLLWEGAVDGEVLAVDGLGSDAGLVRASIGGSPAALVWVQLPAGWRLRFASLL
ncbi:MAG: ribonuclease HI [Tessaracoccus sp.]|uniref:ribonuclease H family protein n=1 Tax=Tessaracoccus sp. TaxID=1971211 RepID=UPI001ECF1ADE|nr:ribonuclease H [Tessaracoccus sp.]MBK7821664.1 ribonuclease HI [Tessaracoccus sp.]